MTAIAFVFAWLLAMLTGHPAPVPVPPAPRPAVVSVDPAGRAPATVQQPAEEAPTVAPDPELQPQLPEEVTGRQIDCPDGQVGAEDADGVVHCP